MDQQERRLYLLRALLEEDPSLRGTEIPLSPAAQARLVRALMNVRMPHTIDPELLAVHDAYLQECIEEMGITYLAALKQVTPHQYLWRGNIVTLATDAIVNDANSGLTGCWVPGHDCIDNRIHTYAGMLLREECALIVIEQGEEEPVGRAQITDAYNLPCKKVIHTVAPAVQGTLTKEVRDELVSCYTSCYEIAKHNELSSLAYPCLATSMGRFPREAAAMIATSCISRLQAADAEPIDVVFCCDEDDDYVLYQQIFGAYA